MKRKGWEAQRLHQVKTIGILKILQHKAELRPLQSMMSFSQTETVSAGAV